MWKGLDGTWMASALGFPCLCARIHQSCTGSPVLAVLLLKPDGWVLRWGRHQQGWEDHVPPTTSREGDGACGEQGCLIRNKTRSEKWQREGLGSGTWDLWGLS